MKKVKDTDVLALTERKVEITSREDLEKASEVLVALQGALKRVVSEREKVTKPLWTALEAERDRFRGVEKKLGEAISGVRREMSRWQGEQVQRAAEKAEKAAQAVLTGEISAEEGLQEMVEVDNKVGGTRFRTIREVVVYSEQSVPREYLVVDLVKVRAALEAGMMVCGARLEERQVPVVRGGGGRGLGN